MTLTIILDVESIRTRFELVKLSIDSLISHVFRTGCRIIARYFPRSVTVAIIEAISHLHSVENPTVKELPLGAILFCDREIPFCLESVQSPEHYHST